MADRAAKEQGAKKPSLGAANLDTPQTQAPAGSSGGNTSLVSTTSSQTDQFSLARMVNLTQTAEGTILPPRAIGNVRVPAVHNFRVIRKSAATGETIFTLGWDLPQDEFSHVDGVNILVGGAFYGAQEPYLASTAANSPCLVRVKADRVTTVTFYAQTILSSGFVGDMSLAPTCAGVTFAPGITPSTDIPAGSVSVDKLANATAGDILSWDNAGVATLVTPGTSGQFLLSQGAGNLPAWQTPTRTRLLPLERLPIAVSGAPTYTTVDNVLCASLPDTADSEMNYWFRVPPDALVTQPLTLILNYRPDAAPGATNNKVKLKITPKVQNSVGGLTAGDTLTLANDTNWASYTASVNVVAGGAYAAGNLVQILLRRDTTVANNAAVAFDIGQAGILYTVNL